MRVKSRTPLKTNSQVNDIVEQERQCDYSMSDLVADFKLAPLLLEYPQLKSRSETYHNGNLMLMPEFSSIPWIGSFACLLAISE